VQQQTALLAFQAERLMAEFDEVYATLELPDPCHDTDGEARHSWGAGL
jgi:hypothetical protein